MENPGFGTGCLGALPPAAQPLVAASGGASASRPMVRAARRRRLEFGPFLRSAGGPRLQRQRTRQGTGIFPSRPRGCARAATGDRSRSGGLLFRRIAKRRVRDVAERRFWSAVTGPALYPDRRSFTAIVARSAGPREGVQRGQAGTVSSTPLFGRTSTRIPLRFFPSLRCSDPPPCPPRPDGCLAAH